MVFASRLDRTLPRISGRGGVQAKLSDCRSVHNQEIQLIKGAHEMNTRMMTRRQYAHRALALIAAIALIAVTSTRLRADTGTCPGGSFTVPFTDVAGNAF